MNPRHRRRSNETDVYWFVYLGEIDLTEAIRSLLELFPDQDAEERAHGRGSTTMAAIVLDSKGRPVNGRFFLSSFAWGYGQVRAGRFDSLDQFSGEERALCLEIENRLIRQDKDGEALPVSATQMDELCSWLTHRLNLPTDKVKPQPLVVRIPVKKRFGQDVPEPELLNSFFLEDLTAVRLASISRPLGPALSTYLSGVSRRSRRDVVRDRELLAEVLAPGALPGMRWPAPGGHFLALMQQTAVNHAVAELRDGGILGVNGPPGTGKTTLVRDLVAAILLERARALAKFPDPKTAFGHVAQIKLGQSYIHLYRLSEELLGHEIVVASSNNKAVENISREIPAIGAIAENLDPPLRYFSSIADLIAAGPKAEEPPPPSSWGLAAAVLGNAANKAAFSGTFWWHETRSMRAYLRAIIDSWQEAPNADKTQVGAAQLEDAPKDLEEAKKRWQSARREFLEQEQRCQELTERLETIRQALMKKPATEAVVSRWCAEAQRLDAVLCELGADVEAARLRAESTRAVEELATVDWSLVMKVQPGLLARIFRTVRYRVWQSQLTALTEELNRARQLARAAEQDLEALRRKRQSTQDQRKDIELRRQAAGKELESLDAVITGGRELLAGPVPDEVFWSQPEEALQLSTPWLSPLLEHERSRLFAAAFSLHRAFIDAAAQPLRHNLAAAMAVLFGRPLSEKQEPARRSLWASLFLVVPVISTTFASTTRLFGRLGAEQIGWLLIDEAGQAAPQAAVGAIWRARRVIALGDPLQIEPVVSIPPRLTAAIFRESGVEADDWAAPRNSVQALADRVSWLGTNLQLEDGDLWVGTPLRAHRRCLEPMFSISNHIAYGGLMVQATVARPSPIGEILGESAWLDLDSDAAGKWAEPEGNLAVSLIERLFQAGLTDPDVFVITPFRLVAQRLRERIQASSTLRSSLPASPWSWVADRVGTVHTFQGKEAEAVIFVLGAPLAESAGARRWAGGAPNLLNVAVSRARCRLYVIGSHQAWCDAGVFRVLARKLQRRVQPAAETD